MILARTLPTSVAPPTRQTGDAARTSSDGTDKPFGGVLDELADQRGRSPQTKGAGTLDGQARKSPPTSAALALDAMPAASTALPDLSTPAATVGLPAAMPVVAAGPSDVPFSSAVTSPADLAALLAGLASADAGEAAGAATPDAGTTAGRGKGSGKAAASSGNAVPASAAAATDVGALSNLLGLAPMAVPQVAQTAKGSAGQDVTAASTTAVAGQTAAGQASEAPGDADLGGAAAARGASAPSRAHADDGGSAVPLSSLAPIVRSVSVETQLAPAVSLQPMQQVIISVQKLAATVPGAAADLPATSAAPLQSSRTMTLVLEPPDLGTVTVRMQLRGDSLDLQLDVGSAQTLGLLSRDKDSLTAAMASQDYQIGTLTMRASDTQTSSQGSDHGSRPQDQPAGGSHTNGGDPSQGRQAPQGESGLDGGSRQEQRNSRSRTRDDEVVAPRSSGAADAPVAGGLYI